MEDIDIRKELEQRTKPIGRNREPTLFTVEVVLSIRALDLWDALLELETMLWCSPNVESVYYRSGGESK